MIVISEKRESRYRLDSDAKIDVVQPVGIESNPSLWYLALEEAWERGLLGRSIATM